jgi:hypothetical protein
LGRGDHATEITATQIRDLIARLVEVGAWRQGDPPVLFALDAGYDVIRFSWLLADLLVVPVARIRSDRVMRGRPPPVRADGLPGRRPRHGACFELSVSATWTTPDVEHDDIHARNGQVDVQAWGRQNSELERRKVTDTDLDCCWRSYPLRFDIERTFRFLKKTLGLTRLLLRRPEQAYCWVSAHDRRAHQAAPGPRPVRGPARPRPSPPRMHPHPPYGKVPAKPPKPSRPGPGRPRGSTSRPAPRHPVGKNQPKKDTPRRGSKQPTG